MKRSLRIAVADDEAAKRKYFQRVLPRMGHEVVSVAETGRELVEQCRTSQPDLVITDIKMPDMDGIEAAAQICRDGPVPIILVSGHEERELVERAEADCIMAYLIKPIRQAQLGPAITIAMRRFEQFRILQKEAADLRQALEDRKRIEQAKGILMKRAGLAEDVAFRRMQKLAREKNIKVVDIAEIILAVQRQFKADK
ncbi:MAG: response regulator [Planctomycetes bacterium]|nr:response regulator [Planctomycetota bacterium]